MRAYDFNTNFSPEEFQNFARDMLQKREDIIFESFAEGKDQGIDGRYIAKNGMTILLQVKRLKNMSAEILKIMKKEKMKMDKLVHDGHTVDRYILALSDDITPDKKDKIMDIMIPYIKAPKDIVTKADFANWLTMKEFYEIEENHPQLWYPGIQILNKNLFNQINAALLEKSRICYEEMLSKKEVFVKTDTYRETILKAQKNRTVIISGEPGVGKTTLAEQVALFYLGKYHSEIFISVSSVEDLYIALSIDGKKVIFYDDFWGSNGLDIFKVRELSGELVRIIEKIRRSKDCVLIMTTREYILEQGLKKNKELHSLLQKYKLECRMKQYSYTDKLQIYYGHLKSAELTWAQTNALVKQESEVVYSPNYNPRVLEQFMKNIKVDMLPEECVDMLRRYLKCPIDFWKDVFEGLSREAQIVYVMMTILPLPIELGVLETCYHQYLIGREDAFEWKCFSDVIIELEKTVIRTDLYSNTVIAVTFQNPSVKDFLIHLLRKNYGQYRSVLDDICLYYGQYVEYLKLLNDIEISVEIYREIFENAMSALESKSISFYQKYQKCLRFSGEMGKYYDHFISESHYEDIGIGRYLQLLALYRKGCGKELENRIKRMFEIVMYQVEYYPESLLVEDMNVLPEVIISMYQTDICSQVISAVEIYMNCLMRNRRPITEIEIGEMLPEVWTEYVKKHQEQLGKYLEKYYNAELCTTAASGDVNEFADLLCECEECYTEYKMKVPKRLNERIDVYDSWLVYKEEDDDEIRLGKDEIHTIEEIQKMFKEKVLQGIIPQYFENLEDVLKRGDVSDEIWNWLNALDEDGDVIWENFMYDDKSLEFLVTFMEKEGKLPQNMEESIHKLAQYILEQSGLTRQQMSEFLRRLNEHEKTYAVWSERELEELGVDLLLENEEFLAKMVESKILIKHLHWYRWTNDCLPLCMKFDLESNGKEIDRERFVQALEDCMESENM